MAKNAKRLGRGLGGLISSGIDTDPKESPKSKSSPKATKTVSKANRSKQKTKSDAPTDGETLIEVPIDKVRPNRYQPRKRIDAVQIKELAASIKAAGLIQPIAVRPHEDGYEIIAGERRWRAFRELGRKTIPVLVLDVEDASSAALSLIENLQREGLDPVEEALGCAALIQDFDLTQAQVAERLGKSRVYVTNAMRLLQLGEEIQQELADGRLSVGHAKVLLGLEDEAARVHLARRIVENGLSVRQAEDEVEAAKSKGSPRAAKPLARTNAKRAKKMADQLSYLLNTKVRVSSNGEGRGRIVIEYENADELTKLGSQLGL
ncbi:MAG: ParB/RepB/Spo0J family partition protein [Opitutales bacterium]